MQFSLVCDVLLQQCLTEVIGTIPVLIWDSVKDHRLCSDSSCCTGVEVAGPFESRYYRVRVVRLRRRYCRRQRVQVEFLHVPWRQQPEVPLL